MYFLIVVSETIKLPPIMHTKHWIAKEKLKLKTCFEHKAWTVGFYMNQCNVGWTCSSLLVAETKAGCGRIGFVIDNLGKNIFKLALIVGNLHRQQLNDMWTTTNRILSTGISRVDKRGHGVWRASGGTISKILTILLTTKSLSTIKSCLDVAGRVQECRLWGIFIFGICMLCTQLFP